MSFAELFTSAPYYIASLSSYPMVPPLVPTKSTWAEAAEWEKTDTELVMYVSLDAASAHTIKIIGKF